MRGLVSVSGTREAKLPSGASVPSSQIERATAELPQAGNTITTQSMDVAKIAQLKSSIKRVEDRVRFYEACEKDMKSELEASITKSTRIGQLFDDIHAEVVDLREWLRGKDDDI